MTIPLIERFRDRLPVTSATPVVSLGEGSTPLVLAPRLSERVGAEVWCKLEGQNPTGSFKDRGMTCAVSAAVREGSEAIVCASTDNTAASAAPTTVMAVPRRPRPRPRHDFSARASAFTAGDRADEREDGPPGVQ